MLRIEDLVIKTIIAGELPIASACKMFMPHPGNCFGELMWKYNDIIDYVCMSEAVILTVI